MVQWIEDDVKALNHNIDLLQNTIGNGMAPLAVVKANAHRHGQIGVAQGAAKTADWLGRRSAAEARHLRQNGVKIPVLIISFVSPSEPFDFDLDPHLLGSSSQTLEWDEIYRKRTGVALLFRERDFTLDRVGIAMYGHWPLRETRLSWSLERQGDEVQLKPVITYGRRWSPNCNQLRGTSRSDTGERGRLDARVNLRAFRSDMGTAIRVPTATAAEFSFGSAQRRWWDMCA